MELAEMSLEEQNLMHDFAQAIRFYMEPFRAEDLIVSYQKVFDLDVDIYKLEIRLRGSSLVLEYQSSVLAFSAIYSPETFARALAIEFSKKFREYREESCGHIVLGEN